MMADKPPDGVACGLPGQPCCGINSCLGANCCVANKCVEHWFPLFRRGRLHQRLLRRLWRD